MKSELARHIALVAFRSSANLTELVPLIREHCEEHEYQEFLNGISCVAAEIAQQVLRRLYTQHPDIEKEIDRRIEEYGTLIVT
jgi:hypothetical protein